MNKQKVMLFGYDFPHKKTQDFLQELLRKNYQVAYVLAAPFRKIPVPKWAFDISSPYKRLVHPREICRRFKIPYYVFEHNSEEAISLIKKYSVDFYVIAGARILSRALITACHNKVLNLHPGLLPKIRGLDTLLWSIYYNEPIGISAHFISPKIDSGLLIYKEVLLVYARDSLQSISRRLLIRQKHVLIRALQLAEKPDAKFVNLGKATDPYNSYLDKDLVPIVLKKFPSWRKKYSIS